MMVHNSLSSMISLQPSIARSSSSEEVH